MNEEQQENQEMHEEEQPELSKRQQRRQEKKAKDKESTRNNAELINKAAETAGKTNTPWGKAIGAANKIDNKLLGGKGKQFAGKMMTKANKLAPGAQNAINAASKLKNGKKGSDASQAEQKLQNRQGKAFNRNRGKNNQGDENTDNLNTSGQDNGGSKESSEKQSGLPKKTGLGLKDALSEKVGGGLKNKFKSMFSPKGSSEGATEGDSDGDEAVKKMKGVASKILKMFLIIGAPVIFFFLFFIILLVILTGWFDIHPGNDTTGSGGLGGSGSETAEVEAVDFEKQQCGSDDENDKESGGYYSGPTDCKDFQRAFYKELTDVYNYYAEKKVQLNVNLIMSAIFYGRNMEGGTNNNSAESNQFTEAEKDQKTEEENEEESYRKTDIRALADNMVSDNDLDYEKFQKYLTDDYVPNHYQAYILNNKKDYEDNADKNKNQEKLESDTYEDQIEQVVQAIMGEYYNMKKTSNSNCIVSGNTQANDLRGKTREERIKIVGPIASKVYSSSGVWASATIGQLIKESQIGEAYENTQYDYFLDANNLSGVKCRSGFSCINGYTSYSSIEEALQDRVSVFNGGPYPDWKSKTTPEEFIKYVVPIYCPASDKCDPIGYSNQVIEWFDQYDLKKYDTKDVPADSCITGDTGNTDYKYNGKVTESMKKVAELAKSRSAVSSYDGLCEGWAEGVWRDALGKTGEYMASAYAAWEKFGVSKDKDNIPPGAMVYTSGWAYNSDGSNPYGHVGIYVGDGKVADQGGVKDLEEWLNGQTAPCNGNVGWFGWGWYNNNDLSK